MSENWLKTTFAQSTEASGVLTFKMTLFGCNAWRSSRPTASKETGRSQAEELPLLTMQSTANAACHLLQA